jgi:hypothetical protein
VKLRLGVCGLVLLMGCARGAVRTGERASANRCDIVPFADYHTHLMGPYAPPTLPPAVNVPPELDRLLRDRARLFGNVQSVADLKDVFTEDAQVLDAFINPKGWLRDPSWFIKNLNLFSKDDSRFVPNDYKLGDSTGYVAGTVVSRAACTS